MLELVDISGGWGPTVVVSDVSLAVAKGETVAVVGRNGVGKTTLMELIVGRARRRRGSLRIGGSAAEERPVHERSLMGLGHVPQEREVFRSLSVREHLAVARRPGSWNEERVFALFPSLGARVNSLGGQLSGGEQQMLAIGRALMGNPCVLLMDEPSEGLAPIVVDQLVEAMKLLTADGALSILLVEQRIDIARQLADRFVIMDRGQIVHEDDIENLSNDSRTMAELIGLSH